MAANLSQIKTDSDWGTEASTINRNFSAVNTELNKLNNTVGIKMPLATSVTDAKKNIPSPYWGQMILVGNALPAPVYKWNGYEWASAGFSGGSASAPLTDYYTKSEINSRFVTVKSTNEVKI